jgi:hypothetical protein
MSFLIRFSSFSLDGDFFAARLNRTGLTLILERPREIGQDYSGAIIVVVGKRVNNTKGVCDRDLRAGRRQEIHGGDQHQRPRQPWPLGNSAT